ncbi:MAG TPA: hypothetical protein VIR27_08670, partial [Mycobacteriales bacterium]
MFTAVPVRQLVWHLPFQPAGTDRDGASGTDMVLVGAGTVAWDLATADTIGTVVTVSDITAMTILRSFMSLPFPPVRAHRHTRRTGCIGAPSGRLKER